MMLVIKAQEVSFSPIDNVHGARNSHQYQRSSRVGIGIFGNNVVGRSSPINACTRRHYCKRYGVKM